MLAIIDGLRTKLTALNNTVQGLVNKPSGAVPYSKVGDMWVGLGVVPNPEPGYLYTIRSLGKPYVCPLGYTDEAAYNNYKPWVARPGWGTLDHLDTNSDGSIDSIPNMIAAYSDGLISYNARKNIVYYSSNGITDWKIMNVPDKENLSSIVGLVGADNSNMVYLLGKFKTVTAGEYEYRVYRADLSNHSVSKDFVWVLNTNLTTVLAKTSKVIAEVSMLTIDNAMGPRWAAVVKLSDNTYQVLSGWPNEPDTSPGFINKQLADIPAGGFFTVALGRGILLVVSNQNVITLDLNSPTNTPKVYLHTSFAAGLAPITAGNKLISVPYLNGRTSTFMWISATGKHVSFNTSTGSAVEDITLSELEGVKEPEIGAMYKLSSYRCFNNSNIEIIAVNSSWVDPTGVSVDHDNLFYARMRDGWGDAANWRRISPYSEGEMYYPVYHNSLQKIFMLNGLSGYNVVPQVFFSETWDGGKLLTIPPLANGWWIDYKGKANAE